MGSNSKTKSVKEAEKKKKKIMALVPMEKSLAEKKLPKKTLKLDREDDESTKEKKEKKRNKLGGKKKGKKDSGSEDVAIGRMSLQTESTQSEIQTKIENSTETQISDKSEKAGKKRKKEQLLSKKNNKLMQKRSEAVADEVYHISSGDEDCSKGIKKWLAEYHQSRPGLEILQQKIDEFIAAHEEHEEQARKEREDRSAEGGWTVVQHHKGRKKTTDSESGITVGSVAQAAVVDKMAKKKSKDVGIDFYRFQRREARMNEVMMLQSKFEQDRKRIQQLRAARKFRPY